MTSNHRVSALACKFSIASILLFLIPFVILISLGRSLPGNSGEERRGRGDDEEEAGQMSVHIYVGGIERWMVVTLFCLKRTFFSVFPGLSPPPAMQRDFREGSASKIQSSIYLSQPSLCTQEIHTRDAASCSPDLNG